MTLPQRALATSSTLYWRQLTLNISEAQGARALPSGDVGERRNLQGRVLVAPRRTPERRHCGGRPSQLPGACCEQAVARPEGVGIIGAPPSHLPLWEIHPMPSTRVGLVLICVALQSLLLSIARAGPIGPGDFGADPTVLSFDSFPHATSLSHQFECGDGVILSSTAPIGGSFSTDLADALQPGEAISPFVAAIEAVPSSSTASVPNKVIATKYGAGGELLQCERCGISIRFLDPLPTQVGLWVTDPDAGQTVAFSGSGGALSTFACPLAGVDSGGGGSVERGSTPSPLRRSSVIRK